MQNKTDKEEQAARKIINDQMRVIKTAIPELVVALSMLKLFPVELKINISTDFKHLFFCPKEIVRLHNNDEDKTIRFQILHVVMHGLLGDNETVRHERQSKTLWLALDQRVNDICGQLGYKPKRSNNDMGDIFFYQRKMKENLPYSQCFANYHLAKKNKKVTKKAKAAQRLIASDEHFFWTPIYIKKVLGLPIDEEDESVKIKENWDVARNILLYQDGNSKSSENKRPLEQDIHDMAENLLNSKERRAGKGSQPGNMLMPVESSSGKPVDYRELLCNLLRELEDPRENPDSIDPMYYQFGLDTYGDVPLIEPKEDDEIMKFNTLAVAIDTSGSCCGEVAQKFCKEITALIADVGRTVKNGEIVFFQADAKICKEDTYDIEVICDNPGLYDCSQLRGGGGTSFVPVFDRVKEMQDDGKVIDALIYLSDGYGDFPEKKPEFPTIFVVDTSEGIAEMPEWVQVGFIE